MNNEGPRCYGNDESLVEFLDRARKEPRKPFQPYSYYCEVDDSMHVWWDAEASYAERINEDMDLMLSFSNKTPTGVKVYGVSKMVTDPLVKKTETETE